MLHLVDGVPEVARNKALACGAGAWLDGLEALVSEIECEWSIAVGRPYDGGTEAFVAQAVLADGSPAVLKLVIPCTDDAAKDERSPCCA